MESVWKRPRWRFGRRGGWGFARLIGGDCSGPSPLRQTLGREDVHTVEGEIDFSFVLAKQKETEAKTGIERERERVRVREIEDDVTQLV